MKLKTERTDDRADAAADEREETAAETATGKKDGSRTHHEKCGEVGKTGQHGKLGTNAANRKDADKDEE